MIAELFLAAGVAGTATAVAFAAPAGRGVHRYVVPRSTLRADLARVEDAAEVLTCQLTAALSELEAVTGERDRLWVDLGKAERLVTDAEREAKTLREANKALKATLANATAIRPLVPVTPALPAPATPTPSSVVVPLPQAPFAHSPATEPS